jgi:hypothetical protein
MKRKDAMQYVGHVCDNAGAGRRVGSDFHARILDSSVLVGWDCGFEPMFVAVNCYLGSRVDYADAEDIATEYLKEIGWFVDPDDCRQADYLI